MSDGDSYCYTIPDVVAMRRFKISLRVLLLVSAAAALAVGLIGRVVLHAIQWKEQQHEMLVVFERGGWVTWDSRGNVKAIGFDVHGCSSFSDADVKKLPLQKLDHLVSLNVAGSEVSDASLIVLCKLRSLKHIDVRHTNVTPEGIRQLELELPQCHVSTDLK